MTSTIREASQLIGSCRSLGSPRSGALALTFPAYTIHWSTACPALHNTFSQPSPLSSPSYEHISYHLGRLTPHAWTPAPNRHSPPSFKRKRSHREGRLLLTSDQATPVRRICLLFTYSGDATPPHIWTGNQLCFRFQVILIAQEDHSNDDFLSLYELYFTVSRSPFLLVLNIGIDFFFFTWTFIFQSSFYSFSSFQPNVRQDFQKKEKRCKHSVSIQNFKNLENQSWKY